MSTTIRTYLERAAEQSPAHPALQYREGTEVTSRSYNAMLQRVRTIAELSGNLDTKPRHDRVAMIMENGPQWIEVYLAHAACAVTMVPIDPKLKAAEIAYMLTDAEVTTVYTDNKHLATMAELADDLPNLRHVVIVDTKDKPNDIGKEGTVKALALEPELAALGNAGDEPDSFYARNTARPEDIASVIYTSGTTGLPKGALLTHANFCADAEGAIDLIRVVSRQDRFMIVLPLFHSFSFTANFIAPLNVGATMQFVSNLRSIGEDLQRFQPTILTAVPLLVDKMYAKIKDGIDSNKAARLLIAIGLRGLIAKGVRKGLGGAIRLIVVGGAPCPPEVLIGMRKLGLPVIEGYGLTEASPVVTITTLENVRPGTIGVPLPNIEIRIAHPNEQGVGELQVRGPIVTQGYLKNPEATAEAFEDGWLRTGDLASQDEDGHVVIRGRQKALIVNREGKNIYPEEVEGCIAADDRILDALVIGYHDKGDVGEKVGVIAVPNLEKFELENPDNPDWESIEKQCRAIIAEQCNKLADYKNPRKIEIRREPLERTSIQKIRRHIYQGALDQ